MRSRGRTERRGILSRCVAIGLIWLRRPAIGPISASSTKHFLPAPNAIKVVKKPHQVREDGPVERADCAS